MMKKSECIVAIAVFLTFIAGNISAEQSPGFSLSVKPAFEVPIGEYASIYGIGGSTAARATIPIPSLSFLSVLGEVGYALNTYSTETGFSNIEAGAGAGFTLPLGTAFSLRAYGLGGYCLSFMKIGGEQIYGNGGYVRAGAGAAFRFNPAFSISADASYRMQPMLYNGLSFHLGAEFDLSAAKRSSPANTFTGGVQEGNFLKLEGLQFDQIFPVFYSYYDDHAIGAALLRNPLDTPIQEVSVSFNVEKYMDVPKMCASFDKIGAGATEDIDLFALFNDSILSITQGTKVAAEIVLDYTVDGTRYTDTPAYSVDIEHRNALTWDDDSKAAAFVTEKDPQVLLFSKNTAGVVNAVGGYNIPDPMKMAMGLHESLRLYGMTYVIDPSTPYADLSGTKLQVDYLQFPRETLEYKAGDCDDLSILFNALLESVGIETAFITVPGHIYAAFNLQQQPEDVRKNFLKPDDFIFTDGKSWIPVEVTALEESFLEAWQEGAKQWREHSSRDQAGFHPVHEAWAKYKSVGLPGDRPPMTMPDRGAVAGVFKNELVTFIEREIYPQVSELERRLAATNSPAKYANKLGVLYARYGLYDKAVPQLEVAIEDEEYLPALINLGNIHFLLDELFDAQEYYDRAAAIAPESPKVLLAQAKVHHELENYGTVRQVYEKLESIDKELAERYAYLDLRGAEAARAAEVSGMKDEVLWEEEE